MSIHYLRSAIVAGSLAFAAAMVSAAPVHLYDLNGNLDDAMGGPSLVANGGVLGASSYQFGANQGLGLANALPASEYTLDMAFRFAATSGWRKIVDFKNLSSDAGIYSYDSWLQICDCSTQINGPAGDFVSNQMLRLTLTRNATTNMVDGYVNGVLRASYLDSSQIFVFDAANQIGNFFIDDFATGQGEASGGEVDFIAVYDHALTAGEIAGTANAVPEPQAPALIALGLGAMLLISRRRRA